MGGAENLKPCAILCCGNYVTPDPLNHLQPRTQRAHPEEAFEPPQPPHALLRNEAITSEKIDQSQPEILSIELRASQRVAALGRVDRIRGRCGYFFFWTGTHYETNTPSRATGIDSLTFRRIGSQTSDVFQVDLGIALTLSVRRITLIRTPGISAADVIPR